MKPYKFIAHSEKTISEILEENKNSPIHKAYESQKKDKLSRSEKNEIARLCYGIFGANSSTCKLMGVAYPFSDSKHVKRILVKYKYDDYFKQFYAPDKTSLRDALPNSYDIETMIYA